MTEPSLEESTALDSVGGYQSSHGLIQRREKQEKLYNENMKSVQGIHTGSSMLRGSPSMYKLVLVSSLSRSIRDLKVSPSVSVDDGDGESWGPEDGREA